MMCDVCQCMGESIMYFSNDFDFSHHLLILMKIIAVWHLSVSCSGCSKNELYVDTDIFQAVQS